MKRYVRIFLLYFQDAFESRSRSVVWFLLALLNPLIALLFWSGALRGGAALRGWNLTSFTTYYFLLIIANAFLNVHIEEEVATEDIQEGRLSVFLLRPFSYLYQKFCVELPNRIIQGFLGIIVFLGISFWLGKWLVTTDSQLFLIACLVTLFAFVISFLFKMIVGITAFWVTDYRGLQELVFVTILVFAGLIMPLDLFPDWLAKLAYVLPFSYMIYFPVIAIQGKLPLGEIVRIVVIQLVWIGVLALVYREMWRRGTKLFVGVGL